MNDDAIRAAQSLQQQGRFPEAIAAYRELLNLQPNAPFLLANLATCLRQTGELAMALAAFENALQLAPDAAPIWFNAANAYLAANRPADAERAFQRALAINDQFAAAWFNLARLWQTQARLVEAESAYAKAITLEPDNFTALMNHGNVLRVLGRTAEAIAAHQRVVHAQPARAEARLNLANALRDAKQPAPAREMYLSALALRDDLHAARLGLVGLLQSQAETDAANAVLDAAIAQYPQVAEYWFERASAMIVAEHKRAALPLLRRAVQLNDADARIHNALGIALESVDDKAAALRAFERAITLDPKMAIAHANFAQLARQLGKHRESIDALRQAVALAPNDARTLANLIDGLVVLGLLQEAIELAEQALARDLIDPSHLHTTLGHAYNSAGRIAESRAHLLRAVVLKPSAINRSNALFASLYDDADSAEAISALHREHAAQIEPASASIELTCLPPSPSRRIRIGYVSADFYEHPVGFFIQPLWANHDRQRFEVFAYATRNVDDALGQSLRAQCEHWRDAVGLGNNALLDLIRTDTLDILIDLAGHSAHNVLSVFAARAAPRQLSYLGYPFTTGLPMMDGYIADAITVPTMDAALHSEAILRLPHFAFCMRPHPSAPEVSVLPALARGFLTFGCFNNLAKLSPSTLRTWSLLLHAIPDARLCLRALGLNDASTCERVLQAFSRQGIATDRISLLPPIRPIEAFLRGYEEVDIALDPMPFNGGTTSFEALWQGVPVLTIAGRGFCARMGAGINHSAGLDAFSAMDIDDFIARAKYWRTHVAQLAALRAGLRETLRNTSLFDGATFTRGFEAALEQSWQAEGLQ